MLVGQQQVRRRDGQSGNLDRAAEIHKMYESVRDGNAAGKNLEAALLDAIHISHGAVRDSAYAAQPEMNVRMNFSPVRATSVRMHAQVMVHILVNDDPRTGN